MDYVLCSVNDWTLGLLYRVHSSSSIWLQAAGMYKVRVAPRMSCVCPPQVVAVCPCWASGTKAYMQAGLLCNINRIHHLQQQQYQRSCALTANKLPLFALAAHAPVSAPAASHASPLHPPPCHPQVEVPGVENINLSRLVSSHRDYLAVMDDVLEVINMHDA